MLYVKLHSTGWCDVRTDPPCFDEALVAQGIREQHDKEDIIIVVGTTLEDPTEEQLEAMAFAMRLLDAGSLGVLMDEDLLEEFQEVLETLDDD